MDDVELCDLSEDGVADGIRTGRIVEKFGSLRIIHAQRMNVGYLQDILVFQRRGVNYERAEKVNRKRILRFSQGEIKS
jgi:hypothetical protein